MILCLASPDRDANPRHIGGTEAVANLFGPHTGARDCLPVPAIKAKDAIGFRHHLPALEIVENVALGLADLDMLGVEPAS